MMCHRRKRGAEGDVAYIVANRGSRLVLQPGMGRVRQGSKHVVSPIGALTHFQALTLLCRASIPIME